MKIIYSFILILTSYLVTMGQVYSTAGTGAPSGACTTGIVTYTNQNTGQFYTCVAGAWNLTTASATAQAALPVSTAEQTALNLKANTASLSTVATTGAYADLSGKPTLGGAASLNVGTITGTVSAGDDSRITGAAQKASNLSDLANASTARTNLGLGSLATQSGTFSGTSSGTNTGDQSSVTGNAGTATILQNARLINGTSFNGSADITVTAAAGTLTGNTLNSGVTTSSLTSVGTLASGAVPTSLLTGTVTNAQLAGSIDLTSKVINVLPFANGGNQGAAATPATTGTMSVSMTTSVVTITPTGACTFNGTGGLAGETASFIVTTSGASSFVLTWGTNFKTVSTLATGTITGKVFAVTFRNTNGSQWVEIGRTTAQ